MNEILIISNDKIFFSKKKIYSHYNDTLNIIETISKKFNIYLLSRHTRQKQTHSINSKKITNFFSIDILKLKNKKIKVFMISITLLNLLRFLIVNLFIKKITGYVYIRSDGFKEYYYNYGFVGRWFYSLLYKFVSSKLKVICVNPKMTNIKTNLRVTPSEISKEWSKNYVKSNYNVNHPRILYFGRFRKEKGIYSLLNIIKKASMKLNLTLAGDINLSLQSKKNISLVGRISSKKEIINLYDTHDIFILPSYTEGSPKVILESLSRHKPVIVFNEIKHVKNNFNGVFVVKRNHVSLTKKIMFIMKNYQSIKSQIKKNKINTKKNFQYDLLKILTC